MPTIENKTDLQKFFFKLKEKKYIKQKQQQTVTKKIYFKFIKFQTT